MRRTSGVSLVSDATSNMHGEAMLRAAEAMAAIPDIDNFHHTGWLPPAFFERLAEFYRAYDAFIKHSIQISDLKIKCQAACSRCCLQPVRGVYSFEIINLYREIRNRPNYAGLHNQFNELAAEFHREVVRRLPDHPEETITTDHPAIEAAHRAIAARRSPCALLVDDQCSAYEHRPISCRMYHSLTDPRLCTSEKGETFLLEPLKAVDDVLLGVADRLGRGGGMLASGIVTFGFERTYRPWGIPESQSD